MIQPVPSEVALYDQMEAEISRLVGMARRELGTGENPVALSEMFAMRMSEASVGNSPIAAISMLAVAIVRIAELTPTEEEDQ